MKDKYVLAFNVFVHGEKTQVVFTVALTPEEYQNLFRAMEEKTGHPSNFSLTKVEFFRTLTFESAIRELGTFNITKE